MHSINIFSVKDGWYAGAAGIKAVGTSTSGLLKTWGPLGIALAAATAIFFAIRTNAFGFRDALNSVGVEIGNLLPGLKPLLKFIADLGVPSWIDWWRCGFW